MLKSDFNFPFSNSMDNLIESNTSSIFNLAKSLENQGRSVIHLEIGEPDYHIPKITIDSVKSSIDNNQTNYVLGQGLFELRREIANYYKRRFNIDVNPKKELIVTPGAKFGLYLTLYSLINPGDEVIIIKPSWPTYSNLVNLFGGKIKEFPLSFKINQDITIFKSLLSEKTKLLIINFPNNPTSIMVNKNYLKNLVQVILAYRNLIIISDEIYMELTHDGKVNSMIQFSDIINRLVIISGFSKSFSMTGFRLGYVLAPFQLIKVLLKLVSNTITCVPPFIQMAAVHTLQLDEHIINARKFYKEKMEEVIKFLKDKDNISFPFVPNSSFYLFFKVKNGYESLALDILNKTGVATIPGIAFGENYKNFLRISITRDTDQLFKGISKILSFIEKNLT